MERVCVSDLIISLTVWASDSRATLLLPSFCLASSLHSPLLILLVHLPHFPELIVLRLSSTCMHQYACLLVRLHTLLFVCLSVLMDICLKVCVVVLLAFRMYWSHRTSCWVACYLPAISLWI